MRNIVLGKHRFHKAIEAARTGELTAGGPVIASVAEALGLRVDYLENILKNRGVNGLAVALQDHLEANACVPVTAAIGRESLN